jgi:hypothetical protein
MRRQFQIVLLMISMTPVIRGKMVDLGSIWSTEGEMVRVQEHRKIRLITMTA